MLEFATFLFLRRIRRQRRRMRRGNRHNGLVGGVYWRPIIARPGQARTVAESFLYYNGEQVIISHPGNMVARRLISMCTIRVGGERHEFLAIKLLGRSHSLSGDYWDDNWISAVVEVAAGGFRGKVEGCLRSEELVAMVAELGHAIAEFPVLGRLDA